MAQTSLRGSRFSGVVLAGIQILLLSISMKVGIMESYEGFTVKKWRRTPQEPRQYLANQQRISLTEACRANNQTPLCFKCHFQKQIYFLIQNRIKKCAENGFGVVWKGQTCHVTNESTQTLTCLRVRMQK